MGMKAPSGDLLFYAAVLLGGAIYFTIRLPTTAVEYQTVAVAMAVCMAAEAVLLLVRFRWSPELFVAIALFFLGWGIVQGVANGFTGNRIGITAGAVAALFAYPVLKREVRGRATPDAESLSDPTDLRSEEYRGEDGMQISPEFLPAELHYIIPLAEQHGYEARVVPFDRELQRHVVYAEHLSEADLAPLRDLYAAIRAKGHADRINEWHHNQSRETCPAETTFPVYGLLCLFAQLKKLDVAPFNDGTVGRQEKKVELDWNKLPPPLRYLAEPAARYGAIQFENQIMYFLEREATDADRMALRELQSMVIRDEAAINSWIDELGMTKHQEAALVYFLLHLMALGNDAGLL